MRLLPFLMPLTLLLGSHAAAAFNCIGVTLPSTIVICSDSELSKLADERQQIYDETRSRLTPEQQAALWEDQKAWVRSYPAACAVPAESPPPAPVPASVVECFKRAALSRATYLHTYGLSPTEAAAASSGSTIANTNEVGLVQEGGVFHIPVRINEAITLNFVIDSGAADVQIPLDVFSTLIRAKTITDSDLVGEKTYVLADGSKQKAPKFLIREIKVGDHVLHNVAASVGSPLGALLLGQSFLSHFDAWTIDNRAHVLRLVPKSGDTEGTRAEVAPD